MDTNLILEKVEAEDINLDSFEIKPKLNPKIWANDNKVRPEVRDQLLKIADDFYEFLDTPWVEVIDVRLTGSLANYNWSKFSDVDLHILIDYKEVNSDKDLVAEYMKMKKDAWSEMHDLKINDYDVELYAEDVNGKLAATGIYSLDDDEWTIKPKKLSPKFDRNVVKEKAAVIVNKIDEIEEMFNNEEYEKVLTAYTPLWDEIKSMRKRGLTRIGEFSIENIVFKVLRRTDYLEKLQDLKNRAYDITNSIITNEEW